jgi:outer membrane receptor protein involved in Fe transport
MGTTCGPNCIFGAVTECKCCLALYGGNRNLKAETSENFDFGVVLEPIRNMGITLDYWATGPAGYNPIFSDPTLRTFYVNLKYDF